jgi:hypothetical protein
LCWLPCSSPPVTRQRKLPVWSRNLLAEKPCAIRWLNPMLLRNLICAPNWAVGGAGGDTLDRIETTDAIRVQEQLNR